MSLLNSFARANKLFAIHVPMVSQLTRYATPVAIREFDTLCSRIELDGESGNFNFEDGLRDIEEVRVAYVSVPRARSSCATDSVLQRSLVHFAGVPAEVAHYDARLEKGLREYENGSALVPRLHAALRQVCRNFFRDHFSLQLRNFSQLYETAAFSYRTLRANRAPPTILAEADEAVEEIRRRLDEIRASLEASLAANSD